MPYPSTHNLGFNTRFPNEKSVSDLSLTLVREVNINLAPLSKILPDLIIHPFHTQGVPNAYVVQREQHLLPLLHLSTVVTRR